MIKTEPKNQLSELIYSICDKVDDVILYTDLEYVDESQTIPSRTLRLALEISQGFEPAHINKLIENNAELKDEIRELKFDVEESERKNRESNETERERIKRENILVNELSAAFLVDGNKLCESDKDILLSRLKKFIGDRY